MTQDAQISAAADLIDQQLQDKGIFGIGRAECMRLARLLFDQWQRPGREQRHIPAGEVAQKFRDRYEAQAVLMETGLALADDGNSYRYHATGCPAGGDNG